LASPTMPYNPSTHSKRTSLPSLVTTTIASLKKTEPSYGDP
jgi:hypothetical protein